MVVQPRVLVTGFEPFGGERVNPSAEIVRALRGRVIAGHGVAGWVLPCVFGASLEALREALRRERPMLVVALGQAGGRTGITPERVAVNLNDARIPDNAGERPVDTPVVPGGATAFWSTLPVKAIVAALQARGVPAAVSPTAGTYVCNHVFYGLMHALRRRRGVRGGFIHVPWLPEQAPAGQPSLPLERMVEAVELAIEVSLQTAADEHWAAGETH